MLCNAGIIILCSSRVSVRQLIRICLKVRVIIRAFNLLIADIIKRAFAHIALLKKWLFGVRNYIANGIIDRYLLVGHGAGLSCSRLLPRGLAVWIRQLGTFTMISLLTQTFLTCVAYPSRQLKLYGRNKVGALVIGRLLLLALSLNPNIRPSFLRVNPNFFVIIIL